MDMRRGLLVLVFVWAALVVAQGTVTLSLDGKTSSLPGYSEGGKLYVAAKPLATLLRASLSVSGSQAIFKLGGSSAAVALVSKAGAGYVVGADVAKGLGFSVAGSGTALSLKSPQAAQPAVQGTQQLAGGEGQIGQTYTLRAGTSDALNLTITRLEYVAGHFIVGGDDLIRPDSKLVVIYATVQNPMKDTPNGANRVAYSGVDSNNKTIPGNDWFDLKTRETAFVDLKPGQKLDLFTFMTLDNGASLPKLIVEDGEKVLRYDLKGKIAPLTPPLVDPASGDGSAVPAVLKGVVGTVYPGYMNDLTMDSLAFSDKSIGDVEVPEGSRLLVVNFTLKGTGPSEQSYGSYNTGGTLLDADNQEVSSAAVLLASRDAEFSAKLAAGAKSSGRLIFKLEKDQKPASLKFQVTGTRDIVFDLSGLK
jgi:hypothetical protein